MAKKRIDETVRQEVIKDHKDGLSQRKIAEKFGISHSSVGRIINEKGLQPSGEHVPEAKGKTERQRKIEDLERRIAALEKKILDKEARKKG